MSGPYTAPPAGEADETYEVVITAVISGCGTDPADWPLEALLERFEEAHHGLEIDSFLMPRPSRQRGLLPGPDGGEE